MENFVFQNTTKIIFGRDTDKDAGSVVKKYADKVLLHYGGGSIKKYGIYERIAHSLQKEGVKAIELSGVKPNPVLEMVNRGIDICRKENIKFILSVGGGSVIDSGKAIAVGVPYDGNVWDFFEGKAKPEEALPTGVVLTIPAAGSESSDVSVITNEDGLIKRGYHHQLIRPRFAILNPKLTFTLPAFQSAAGAADIISHVLERYFTHTRNADLTDRLCESTIKTVIKNTPVVLNHPDNYNSRAEIMWASTLAHNGLLGTGRVEDWGSHKIGHELSAIYGITHGASLAIAFPAWMKYVYKKNICLFAQLASRVFNIETNYFNMEETALEGIERLISFFKSIGLPTSLKEANIGDDRFEEMAQKCVATGPKGNFIKMYAEDVINILKIAQ
ncbi:MAG: iron-containing alcohol dehydrogenase [Actinomycetota bacterium]